MQRGNIRKTETRKMEIQRGIIYEKKNKYKHKKENTKERDFTRKKLHGEGTYM